MQQRHDVLQLFPERTIVVASVRDNPYRPWVCRRNDVSSLSCSSATGSKTVVQSFPKSGSFLFDELFSTTFDRVFASGNGTQGLFMTFQFGQGGRGDGNVTFQQIQRQFADGIDLIRVGMLQQRLTGMTTALSQHLLEKRSLSPYSFHGNTPHTMMTRRYHSQYFIDNHVYERFLGHGHASDETQQGGSLVQKLSVHQTHSLVQQLQQRFPSPPHASNETPQRRVLFHRYPSLTLDDATRLKGSLLRNLLSSLSLGFSQRRFDDTFHPVRLFVLRDGFRCRRCICRGGEYCSS